MKKSDISSKTSRTTSRKTNSGAPLSLASPLADFYRGKNLPDYLGKLQEAGIITIQNLLETLPLKIEKAPPAGPFSLAQEGNFFRGRGRIVSLKVPEKSFSNSSSFKNKNFKKDLLKNLTIVVKDLQGTGTLLLQWFHLYPSQIEKMKVWKEVEFFGVVTLFQGRKQIISPHITPYPPQEVTPLSTSEFLIQYPTINGVSPTQIKKLITKIPADFWALIPEYLPEALLQKRQLLPLSQALPIIHGLETSGLRWQKELYPLAFKRLVYQEFFLEHARAYLRKGLLQKEKAPLIAIEEEVLTKFLGHFPFAFTEDQKKTLKEICEDFQKERPMRRLIQGDVGCGKTAVAMVAALLCIHQKYQVALMCPTETLANQHFQTFQELLSPNFSLQLGRLRGSDTPSYKKEIASLLAQGKIDLIIGTHALIQDGLNFSRLGLVIIDEQHKFGVEQRLKLLDKGDHPHSLMMSATPIPRTLSLVQYGDLDISTIRTIPQGRKGVQTRLIPPPLFGKFLSFLKTRMELGEQAYIVAPAIEENPDQDFFAVQKVFERFGQYFPEFRLAALHGKLPSQKKQIIFQEFSEGKIQILISTSVIEVGINVLNATVVAILSPERFGLSSLHQLRGRVGRGNKPGFCFLILDKEESLFERLKIFETTHDGFLLAEADLKNRGEGDPFGLSQSGHLRRLRNANLFEHQQELLEAKEDFDLLVREEHPYPQQLMKELAKDSLLFFTS